MNLKCTPVELQKLLNLPELNQSDFGWHEDGPKPMIIVLAANERDRDRLVKYFSKIKGINNKLKLVLHPTDVIGLNAFAIYKSYEASEDSELFKLCVDRVTSRCSGRTVGGTYNLFYPAWVVFGDKIEED